jgi:hypothetical protein
MSCLNSQRLRQVVDRPRLRFSCIERIGQIEGFKLHVTHNMRPFVNRVRYAPEVSSKPDRLEKDLTQAKALTTILEAEATTLRKAKIKLTPNSQHQDGVTNEELKTEEPLEDAVMTAGDSMEEDPEPAENGSEAVERRIEKVMADLHKQGLVDDKAYNAKKVNCIFRSLHAFLTSLSADGNFPGLLPFLSSRCIPHLLLLCPCNGPS